MQEPANRGHSGRRPRSLWRAFGRLLLLVALLPALALALVTIVDQYAGERRLLAERLAASAVVTADGIDRVVEGKLSSIALLADLRSASAPDWPADLAALRMRNPGLVTAIATDSDGRILAAEPQSRVPDGPLPMVDDRDYFREPRRTLAPYVSEAFRGRGLGEEALVGISAPLLHEGRFDGVVEASIRTDELVHERGRAYVERGYELLLVDRGGQVVFSTPGLGLEFLDRVDLSDRFGPPTGGSPAQLRPNAFADDEAGFTARVPMRSGWTLVLAAREAPLLQGVAWRGWALLAMLALVTLGALLAAWWRMRQLERGTGGLFDALSGLAPGERLAPERISDMPEELAPVARAIDDLAGRLNASYAGLQASLEKERGLADSLQAVVGRREQEVAERTDELRRAVAELDRLSRTDPLTGALNVRGLEEWLGSRWPELRAHGPSLGLLAMDIDHFKAFNDGHGHPAGDAALKRVVGAARGALRGPDDEIVRVGGEEFVLLLPGADTARTRGVGERVRLAVHEAGIPHDLAPAGVLTVSLGIAVAAEGDGDDGDVRAALGRADRALYRAKNAGRDRVEG
jgi:diguanylate cyclase (GGDEF)-like protein